MNYILNDPFIIILFFYLNAVILYLHNISITENNKINRLEILNRIEIKFDYHSIM